MTATTTHRHRADGGRPSGKSRSASGRQSAIDHGHDHANTVSASRCAVSGRPPRSAAGSQATQPPRSREPGRRPRTASRSGCGDGATSRFRRSPQIRAHQAVGYDERLKRIPQRPAGDDRQHGSGHHLGNGESRQDCPEPRSPPARALARCHRPSLRRTPSRCPGKVSRSGRGISCLADDPLIRRAGLARQWRHPARWVGTRSRGGI